MFPARLSDFLPRVVILGLWVPLNLGIPFLATMYVLLVRGTEGIPPRPADARLDTEAVQPDHPSTPQHPGAENIPAHFRE